MISAGLPEHVPALHAPVTTQNVLQRVVERMPHMERAGDVGWWNGNAKGRGTPALGPAGCKRVSLLPGLRHARLDLGGRIGFIQHAVTLTTSLERGLKRQAACLSTP